jgi:hypothetical protein
MIDLILHKQRAIEPDFVGVHSSSKFGGPLARGNELGAAYRSAAGFASSVIDLSIGVGLCDP